MPDTRDWILGLVLTLLAVCVVVTLSGCGGSQEQAQEPFGWCCDGLCGLDGKEAFMFEACECAGLVRAVREPFNRGECIE